MFNQKQQHDHYQEKASDWQKDRVAKQLDYIPVLVESCQTAHLLVLFLFPIPLMTALRLQSITSRSQIIKEFQGTVRWEYWLVAFATLSYAIEIKYLLPIFGYFWNFFHQTISLIDLGESLWQFQTVQFLIALTIHLPIGNWARHSFIILPSFEERYQTLKEIRQAFAVNTLTAITLKAEFMKQLPGLLNQAMSTQMQAVLNSMLVNGSITATQSQQLQKLLSQSVKLITSDVLNQIDRPVFLPPVEDDEDDND